MHHREAIDWSRLLSLLGGRDPTAPNPPAEGVPWTARDVLTSLSEVVWEHAVLVQAPLILKQIKAEARRAGVRDYLAYLHFLLFERIREWPTLPRADRDSLLFVRNLLVEASAIPNYNNDFSVPHESREEPMNEALRAIAIWGRTGLRDAMLRAYMPIIGKFATIGSLKLGLRDVNAEYVRNIFESVALKNPSSMGIHGNDLWDAITIMRG